MKVERIFLETSIQIFRRFGPDKLKKELNKVIANYRLVISSTFARMEFTHSFLRDMIYLYSLTLRLNNFGEIVHWLTKLPPQAKRKVNRVLQCIASFYWEKEGRVTDRANVDTLEKLQLWLPHAIDEAWLWFEYSLDGLTDETGCDKGSNAPEREGDAYKPFGTCKKPNKKCKIDEFFKKHRTELENILKELKGIPDEKKEPELTKMAKIIEKALAYPENMLDSKYCWKCGDAILSIECPQETYLYTSNTKHFSHLLTSIGKKLIDENKSSEEEKDLITTSSQ
ncbi:MAG: hypothetical protein HQ575_05235 [Candidatus Omnitrophica bacterium]|nr:hypothetical protein [Candidatus Omnitrophota bacterium]